MNLSILNFDGLLFVLRWMHFYFGILWIGHLYYFNFTQMDFFGVLDAEKDGQTKSVAIRKLVPKALFWFRWGAMLTFVTGLIYLHLKGVQAGHGIYATSWGVAILTGAFLGTVMWANVWFVIWPKQKIVIESANRVAKGEAALPEAANAGKRATIASRTNTLLSIGMLFFMAASSHLPLAITPNSNFLGIALGVLVLVGAVEANALFAKEPGPLKKLGAVVHFGILLTLALYGIIEFLK